MCQSRTTHIFQKILGICHQSITRYLSSIYQMKFHLIKGQICIQFFCLMLCCYDQSLIKELRPNIDQLSWVQEESIYTYLDFSSSYTLNFQTRRLRAKDSENFHNPLPDRGISDLLFRKFAIIKKVLRLEQ